ncbi:BnaC05g08570D [Brassica napus]|uniref:BnaC05g08570D protein n=1 Tax=Brassica napus TaxID=3708 RepID=A0A078G3R2_BRANA|nr:BnaC05g08570D [Brassica napus]
MASPMSTIKVAVVSTVIIAMSLFISPYLGSQSFGVHFSRG